MSKWWWYMALCYKMEPQRRGFSSLTPCPQSGVCVLSYCKGGGLKKPSENIYTHRESKEQSFLHWVCPGLYLYFPVTPWDVNDWMILGVSADRGVRWTQLSQIGGGQRKSFYFSCRSQVRQLLLISPWSRRGNQAFSRRQTGKKCGLSSSCPSSQCSKQCITFPNIAGVSHCQRQQGMRAGSGEYPILPPSAFPVISSWQCQTEIRN